MSEVKTSQNFEKEAKKLLKKYRSLAKEIEALINCTFAKFNSLDRRAYLSCYHVRFVGTAESSVSVPLLAC